VSSESRFDREQRSERRTRSLRTVRIRSPLAARLDQVLAAAIDGQPVVLNVPAAELLAEVEPVALAVTRALDRAGPSLGKQWRVIQAFRRAGLGGELLDALASPDPKLRIASARRCGALRLGEAVPWLGDLLSDADADVQEAAMRALGKTGGGRAVEILVGGAEQLPQCRLAIELSRAASDVDLETLLRRNSSVKGTVLIVLACGLRGGTLRVPRLIAMAQDRSGEPELRMAACRALSMIRDPATADMLRGLANDPDPGVKAAAARARMRINSARKLGRG
jgi:HEAT repeat protein